MSKIRTMSGNMQVALLVVGSVVLACLMMATVLFAGDHGMMVGLAWVVLGVLGAGAWVTGGFRVKNPRNGDRADW
jgi:hypothetical protein